jgi:SAM-dependent methyltransferase
LPPTKFEDGFFDLVFNQSVFSHLDERYQDAWLSELARITRPGGRVVLSVSGIDPFMELVKTWRNAKVDPTHVMEDFRNKGFLFVEDDGWVDGPFPDFYHSTFHAPWYVFDHWSAFFAIKAYVPRGSLDFMDYILLERRP